MDLSFRYDLWWKLLPRSPRDAGRVERICVRPAPGERQGVDAIRVTRERGLDGDRWSLDPQRNGDAQVSLINARVIDSLSRNDGERALACGDNLHVDLELSEANLPTGSTLTIGEAVLEITAQPHRPCRSFVERFGASAAKKVARANRVGRRGRGVMTRVLVDGTIHVGDAIYVKRPARACLS